MAISIKPINKALVTFTIVGTSPIIQHQWSEKSGRQIRDKKLGKKTKDREVLNAEKEFRDAMYRTDDGDYGVPGMAIKIAIISAAHKDLGIEKTLVRKSFFMPIDDSGMVIKMDCSEPVMREDYVRVGMKGTDLRYRPEFRKWSVDITAEIDADMLQIEDVITLVNRAGFGVGIGEWRPEKGGEYGRFEVDKSKPVNVEQIT